MDLKVTRVRARVSLVDLAAEMGVSHQRVSQIESQGAVTPEAEARYREALLQVAERAGNPEAATA